MYCVLLFTEYKEEKAIKEESVCLIVHRVGHIRRYKPCYNEKQSIANKACCCQTHTLTTSIQEGLPAELKHISKRRKRNQQGYP